VGERRVAPAVVGEPEVEVAEHAADRDVADRAGAGQILAFDCSEPLMRLAHLTLGPATPAFIIGPYSFVPAQDQRIEDAVAQGLLSQRRPARRSGGWEELAADRQIVEVFANDRRIEQRLPVIGCKIQSQAPEAICQVAAWNAGRNLLVNPTAPPFDNPDLRRAMTLALDRKAFVDILTDGQGDIGTAMQPPPEGLWGMPPEALKSLPGYDPDVQKNRTEARQIMEKLGYGPEKRLAVTVSTRNVPAYRDPAVIAIDQLKEVYIDGVLETIETANWYPKLTRKDYTVAVSVSENGLDDPDQQFYENYVCGADRNYTGYCNPQVDKLIDQQSTEPDPEKRRRLVWQIEKQLAEDGARPVLFFPRSATCWYPHVKGFTVMVNSNYNGWRMEDVWLDK
jgi:hypothetical protein